MKDWTLWPALRDEGYPAKHLKRPGLEALRALVDAGQVEVVIIYKLDRLTRSVADCDPLMKRFERRHVSLVSLQKSLDATTVIGRLMMNLLASVSQWERQVIGERRRDALPHLKVEGRRHCHIVYDNPEGVALVHRLRVEGYSYKCIAKHLNTGGLRTALGGSWQATVVYGIVQRTHPPREEDCMNVEERLFSSSTPPSTSA